MTVDGGAISALVHDELVYRLILAWLRDDGVGDPLSVYRADARAAMRAVRRRLTGIWRGLDSLSLEMVPTNNAVVERTRSLMAQPGLAQRDSFHAAHALVAGCDLIASTDAAFDDVPGLRRLAP